MERSGQIKSVTSRDFQSVKLWSFQLEGSDRFYRTGKNEPMVTEGEWIKFNEKNGIVLMETLMKVDSGEETKKHVEHLRSVGAAQTSVEIAQNNGRLVSRDSASETDGPTSVGDRIRYQAARRDASNIVIAALHTDHLPHAVNVAKGKRLDLLLQYVEEVTQTLLERESKI